MIEKCTTCGAEFEVRTPQHWYEQPEDIYRGECATCGKALCLDCNGACGSCGQGLCPSCAKDHPYLAGRKWCPACIAGDEGPIETPKEVKAA